MHLGYVLRDRAFSKSSPYLPRCPPNGTSIRRAPVFRRKVLAVLYRDVERRDDWSVFRRCRVCGCRRGGRLRVPEGGVDRLLLKGRLATVPHDGAQKSKIRRRQWSAINRHDARRRACEARGGIGVAVIRVIDRRNPELRRGRNRQPDPDQSLAQQQTISLVLGAKARNIVGRARRPIDQAKYRISAEACIKARLHARRAHAPAVLRLMAAEASAAVGAEICEEGIL